MTLRLAYVAGVSPGRWLRTWAERRPDAPLEAVRVDESTQFGGLLSGEHDVAFVRLPAPEDGLHVIPLWEEVAVAVLPKEHPFADAATLALADLVDEPRVPEQADAAMAVELVAAGTGVAIMPHGVARLHHRRDVVAVPLTDAPSTRIALVWRVERDDEDIQEFVGVVRGRSARSSRGADAAQEAPSKAASGKAGAPKATSGKAGASKAASGKAGASKAASGRPRRPASASRRQGKGRRR